MKQKFALNLQQQQYQFPQKNKKKKKHNDLFSLSRQYQQYFDAILLFCKINKTEKLNFLEKTTETAKREREKWGKAGSFRLQWLPIYIINKNNLLISPC